jgi:phosphoserine phosphatase
LEVFTKRIGIDYVHANELEIIDGKLTGKYLGDIVDGPKKAEYLKAIAEKKAHINQTIAVGDGANDLPMLNLAGLNCFSCQSNGEKTLPRRFPVLVWMGFVPFRISRQAY